MSVAGSAAETVPRTLFRWTCWNTDQYALDMLSHSIGTFRHFFGSDADFLVFADDVDTVASGLRVEAKVEPLLTPESEFAGERALHGKNQVPWLKWGPHFRIDPEATEFYVDSDVFLLADPVELREFVVGRGPDFVVLQEEPQDADPPEIFYGNFGPRLPKGFPRINSGLLGQRAGCDLSAAFRRGYDWWLTEVEDRRARYFDEQGAVLWSLLEPLADGRAALLDQTRYAVVSSRRLPEVETSGGIVALHATHGPVHPAYRRFLAEISDISGLAL